MDAFPAWFYDIKPVALVASIAGAGLISWTVRSIWRLYFHPLSKFPGPKIAAISDAWYAYHYLSGRWPWVVEETLQKYGDVVRIGPNELVFGTPKAFKDLYGSHVGNLETFAKTQINNHGNDEHGGLIWEWDPVRHREVFKKMSPAFGGRALEAKEPTLHHYVDLFVERMSKVGGDVEGAKFPQWSNWLCVDISADMAYNRKMDAMERMEDPPYLQLMSAFNKAVAVIQMSWRFPLLAPLKYIFLYFTAMRPHSHIRDHSRQQLERRIRLMGTVEHLDFIDQLIPEDHQPPQDAKEMRHLEQVAGQLLVAGFEPPAMWLYSTLFHLVKKPEVLRVVSDEVRGAFGRYRDINAAEAERRLPYLTACLEECLRMAPNLPTGMPVVSPGSLVNGDFIPRGVVCQSSPMTMGRDIRHFNNPLTFSPQRWLPRTHPLYDTRFDNDNHDAWQPFGLGPRRCAGKSIAWWQSRVFLAKTLWSFDLELASGGGVDLDRDMLAWGLFQKPEISIRFVPVIRRG